MPTVYSMPHLFRTCSDTVKLIKFLCELSDVVSAPGANADAICVSSETVRRPITSVSAVLNANRHSRLERVRSSSSPHCPLHKLSTSHAAGLVKFQ